MSKKPTAKPVKAKPPTPKKGAKKAAAGSEKKTQKATRSRARANQTSKRNPNQEAFLKAITEVPIIRTAAEIAGIRRETHYKWLKEDPTYADRFLEAFDQGTDRVVETAWKLGVEGVTKPIVSGGEIITTVREYDSKMTQMLARGWKPKVFGTTEHRLTVGGSVDININADNAAALAVLMNDPKLLRQSRALTKKIFALTEGKGDVVDAEIVE